MNWDQQQSQSPDLASVMERITRQHVDYSRKSLRSWIEGHPAMIAEFDMAVTNYKLQRVYWREHSVAWRRVRVVYELQGTVPNVDAFTQAINEWIARLR